MASSKTCISTFLEDIDHEFGDIGIRVERQGYKVDGKAGIKPHCKLDTLKCVDYFYTNNEQFSFYEFSDLIDQRLKLEKLCAALTCDDDSIPARELVKLRKKLLGDIRTELITKFKDSITIRNELDKKLVNIPDSFSSAPDYFIVVPPIDKASLGSKFSDMVRFLDSLPGEMRSAMVRSHFRRVKVLPLNAFV
ncbi:hypothetical protein ACM6VE_001043 [Vibrio parahaemolyticus]